ncbi:hypothetical protein [Kribbella sp. HUAS MG21]|uniref:Uncharacterized protein n=1 Tax=Kribbella sp. HUAS MG21 TaxID=3160966 RepID=A0AAU7TJN3_9ACTN
MRRSAAVVVGVAVLVCAGCSGEPESADAPSTGGTTTAAKPTPPPAEPTTTPTTAPKPTPVALSVPMYQRALTNVEKVIKPYVARVMNARTVAAFDASRAQLASIVVLERTELAKITPPRGLVSAHPQVLDAFDAYAGDVATHLTKAGETKTGCGLPKGADVRLYEAKTGVRTAYAGLAGNVQKAIGKGVKFGALSVPAKPAAPAVIGGRGENGDVFQRAGSRGSGSLRITNAGSDIVVVVTASNPRKPMASIYVRANRSATLNGIRGDYWVYYKTGTNWDARNNRFTENCSYARLNRLLDGSYAWSLTLKSVAGNTTESETEAF